MKPSFSYLGPGQQQRLHAASLEILEKVGACLQDPQAVELLRKAGANIADGGRVHIPPKRVEWALSVAPKSILLYDREGRPALSLDRGNVSWLGSDCLYILDHRSGERRLATLRDVEEAALLADGLSNVDFLMSAFLPSDVPPERANQRQMLAMLEHCAKPILFVTNDFEACRDVVRAAEVLAGGAEVSGRHPSAAATSTSPPRFATTPIPAEAALPGGQGPAHYLHPHGAARRERAGDRGGGHGAG